MTLKDPRASALALAEPVPADAEALEETPRRVADAYAELLTPKPFRATTFPNDEGYHELIVARSIPFHVEELIAPEVINTMPEGTLRAFADHGNVGRALSVDPEAAAERLVRAGDEGLALAAVTTELEREGVRSFCDSYHQLLHCIAARKARIATASRNAG